MIISFSFFSIGYLIAGFLGVKEKLERLGLGYLLAFGLTGIITFGLSILGIPLNPFVAYIIVILGFFSFLFCIKELRYLNINGWWIAILGIILLSLLINTYWPTSIWDAMTIYDFRAKFFSSGRLPTDIKEIQNYGYYLGNYPFMYSFVLALPYLINSSPTTIITGLFMSLIFIFYSYLKGNKYAEILTLVLSTSLILFTHSTYLYSNLPYSVFIIAAAFLVSKYLKEQKTNYLLLGLFMIVCGSWIRYAEPFHYSIFAILFIYLIVKNNKMSKILLISSLIIITIAIRSLWHLYRVDFYKSDYPQPQIVYSVNTLKIDSKVKELESSFNKVTKNIGLYGKYLLNATDIYHMPFLSVLILLIFNKSRRNILKNPEKYFFTLFSMFSIIVLIIGTFIFSTQIPNWSEIPDSVRRMMMFLVPSLLLSIFELAQK